MKVPFLNRKEAGRLLAGQLVRYADHPDVTVLGLPRGGVAVASEIAIKLEAPLDVFVVRKLGVPGQPELAMGAIASGGSRILNHEMIEKLDIPSVELKAVIARETDELIRRQIVYRGRRPPLNVREKTVILADDGIATGSTMRVTIQALRKMHPARLVVAVPVVAASTYRTLRQEVDEVVALIQPEDLTSVGEWYQDFEQLTDEDVAELLQSPHEEVSGTETLEWHPEETGWET